MAAKAMSMRTTIWPLLLMVSARAIPMVQPSAPLGNVRVERSPMMLRASGITYDGLGCTGMSIERLAKMRTYRDWIEASSDGAVFFRAHDASNDLDGLGVYRLAERSCVVYPMFGLAVAVGWYTPQPDDGRLPDDIRGLGRGGGKVWMGSNGVGIMALDLRDGTWSRHDGKAMPLPGIHSFVLHADDDYVFAVSGGPGRAWRERLPDVRSPDALGPALEVYSQRRNAWLRVRSVARENVLQFGWTGSPLTQIPCDTRSQRQFSHLSMGLCTLPAYVRPALGQTAYELGREFAEPGTPLRFILRKEELEASFRGLQ